MNLHTLNPWAILVAAFSASLLGGLWYSPIVFHSAWKKANHFGDNEPQAAGAKVFSIGFVLSLVMAFNLAMFLNDPKTNLAWGATAGHWFGTTTTNQPGTTINISAPARTSPSPITSPAAPVPSR